MTPLADDDRRFLEVAVAHGLLAADKSNEISEHASREGISASDAALQTSAMAPWSVDATNLLMSPRDLAPDYELTGILGSGAAGVVFRAKQLSLNRFVALKTINLLGRTSSGLNESRIQKEAQAIARLQHPNIVVAYGSGFHKGRFCISMELVDGQSLSELLEAKTPLDEDLTWNIIEQVAAGLSHAEQVGIIHRDIKPGNILLGKAPAGVSSDTTYPTVKIVDFGLALDEFHQHDDRLTVTGATLGTPAYVAPEQLQDTTVDCRADIYSLGATAFHMISASAPFSGHSPMKAILQKTIGDDSWRNSLPDTVSDSSAQLISDMTAADPNDRIASYAVLLERIRERDQQNSPQKNPNKSTTKKTPGSAKLSMGSQRRRKVAGGLFVAAFAVIATIVIVTFWPPLNNNNGNGNSPDNPTVPLKWVRTGLSTPLFDGTNLIGQTIKQTGTWAPEQPQGTPLLFGEERTRLTFPLQTESGLTNVSLTFSVYLESDISEIEIQITSASSGQGGTIRLKNGLAEFYTADDKDAPTGTLPFSKVDPREVELHGIEIRREGNRIRARLKGEQIADFMVTDNDNCEVIARCSKARCGIGDMGIAELSQQTL